MIIVNLMKIVILSKIDYAASGFKLMQALKRHTDFDVQLFSGAAQNKLNHPTNVLVTKGNLHKVQQQVNEADILHFKGDWPPEDGYLGLKIPKNKPIVLTTSGSFFRKTIYGGLGVYSNADYKNVTLKTSFETDLLYPEYSSIWTPHPIDSEDKANIWVRNNFPVFMHIPSNAVRKGTPFVEKVFDVIRERMRKAETHIVSGITYRESTKLKQRASVYFDQFKVGFYGNAALEAMQWGIPVVCWLSPMALQQANGQLKGCPIINEDDTDPEGTAMRVIKAIESPMLSHQTKEWCDDKHSYKAVAKQWTTLYKSQL